jgi:hypothetical protein
MPFEGDAQSEARYHGQSGGEELGSTLKFRVCLVPAPVRSAGKARWPGVEGNEAQAESLRLVESHERN